MSEEKKLTEEELKQAFFILRHGSDEGLSEYIKSVLAIENEYNLQKAEIERLTEELDEATNSLVTASRCFTRMETFYKEKCKEFDIAKEKDAADSKQHCEKCRTYWLSKLDAQKERTSEIQKQVDKLENRFENKACCNMSENCSMIQQAVKDTAREILGDIESCIEGMLDGERYMTKNEVEYLLEYILNKNQEYDVEEDYEN